ncbi:hypothetical protein ACIPSE_08060 [Streptomyces sp. NPDC090106]|uniref:hypothetical protein n=1 Tax=Streptomyces sp. NPDC090106 TaxID=3365946 RepID=UPI003827B520
MSPTPVPIPPASVPAGTPAWSSADAARWTQAGPAPWARPAWSVLALLSTVVWAVALSSEPRCSDAAPCTADWVGLIQMALAVGLLYWLARLPELALLAAPALAAIVVWGELPYAEGMSWAANVTVLAALALGFLQARERLAARARQRELAERASGVRHKNPGPLGPFTRGLVPLVTGLLLCAVAATALATGLRGIDADERHAARAVPVTAKVLSRAEESIRVGTDDERTLTVDAFFPEDYDIGSTVTVLEDGPWRRLTAEPYDAFDRQLLILVTALPGVSLLTTAALARRRARHLRDTPVPALRVLDRTDHHGRTWIYAADDTEARTPLFTCFCTPTHLEPPATTELPADTRLHETILLGAPHDSAELTLLTTDRTGTPLTLRTTAPARLL